MGGTATTNQETAISSTTTLNSTTVEAKIA